MGEAVVRYDQDFIGWTEQQARVLQEAAAHGSNLALDWKNLIEEVEGLGRSQYDAVASHVRRVMVHLLKLEFSPAGGPKASWRESVRDARADIEGRLQRDSGLKPRLAEMIGSEAPRATKLEASAMCDYGEGAEAVMARLRGADAYTMDQILGDWLPGDGGP